MRVDKAYSDGYWAMLAPLPEGKHTVHFTARIEPAGADPIDIDIEYTLHVGGFTLLDPSVKQYGKTTAEWGAAWWQWLYQNPGPTHAILDDSGKDCQAWQGGSVFFLAGTFGGPAKRTCTLPVGKALFFPLVNTSNDNAGVEKGKELTDAQLMVKAKQVETAVQEMWLEIDGQVVGKQVGDFSKMLSGVQSFAYEVPNTPKNIYRSLGMDWAGKVPVSFADGYWATLAPLPVGNHTIHFKAKVKPAGGEAFELDVLYDLMVGGAESLAPNGKPYGKTFGEWGNAWWQWVYENPGPDHPVLDNKGDKCMVGQNSDVLMLAGNFGGAVTRTCTRAGVRYFQLPISRDLVARRMRLRRLDFPGARHHVMNRGARREDAFVATTIA